jgi:hypothetical protein
MKTSSEEFLGIHPLIILMERLKSRNLGGGKWKKYFINYKYKIYNFKGSLEIKPIRETL